MSDANPVLDPGGKWLFRVGGVSGLALGLAYLITIPVYLAAGAPPSSGEAWLKYVAGKTTVWVAISALSVLTDLLFVPVGLALYVVLKSIDRNLMLLATAFVALFVVLDLAVTWSNYAALISLGSSYAGAATDAKRAAFVSAADYSSAVLKSTVEAVYSIGTLSLAILIIGLVMLKGIFHKIVAYVGIATGVLGLVSTFGPWLWSGLGLTIIITSALTTVWVIAVGYRLYRLG